MFAEFKEMVVPRIRQGISGQKITITIFFTSTPLLVLEALPKGMKFNQDYFIQQCYQDYAMKSGEFHPGRASGPLQSASTVQCIAMVPNSRRNLTKEASNELDTHHIHQT
jgi:hypothetical protein